MLRHEDRHLRTIKYAVSRYSALQHLKICKNMRFGTSAFEYFPRYEVCRLGELGYAAIRDLAPGPINLCRVRRFGSSKKVNLQRHEIWHRCV